MLMSLPNELPDSSCVWYHHWWQQRVAGDLSDSLKGEGEGGETLCHQARLRRLPYLTGTLQNSKIPCISPSSTPLGHSVCVCARACVCEAEMVNISLFSYLSVESLLYLTFNTAWLLKVMGQDMLGVQTHTLTHIWSESAITGLAKNGMFCHSAGQTRPFVEDGELGMTQGVCVCLCVRARTRCACICCLSTWWWCLTDVSFGCWDNVIKKCNLLMFIFLCIDYQVTRLGKQKLSYSIKQLIGHWKQLFWNWQ